MEITFLYEILHFYRKSYSFEHESGNLHCISDLYYTTPNIKNISDTCKPGTANGIVAAKKNNDWSKTELYWFKTNASPFIADTVCLTKYPLIEKLLVNVHIPEKGE